MIDLDAEALAAAAAEVGGTAAPGDITDAAAAEPIVAEAVARTGRVDVIVNNAGLLRDKVLWKVTDDDWDAVIGVSLTGTFRLTRACVPHFRERHFGRVINISSYTGLHGNVGQAAYAAAKAGVVGFTKTAAKELAHFGVTVNAIVPNARTRMVESISGPQREILESQIPLGRFGEPAEMAATAAFLASDQAAYITGAVVPVDGGLSM